MKTKNRNGACDLHSRVTRAYNVRLPRNYGNMAALHGDRKCVVLVSRRCFIWTLSWNVDNNCQEKRKRMEMVSQRILYYLFINLLYNIKSRYINMLHDILTNLIVCLIMEFTWVESFAYLLFWWRRYLENNCSKMITTDIT